MPLEPLSALSLFCNVLDLAEKGVKAVKFAKDTYGAADGIAKDHRNLLVFTMQMEDIVIGIRGSVQTVDVLQTADEEVLKVAATCQDLINQYKSVLDRCRAQKKGSVSASTKATVRSVFAKGELENLHQSLEAQGSMLRTALASTARQNLSVLVHQLRNADVENGQIKDRLGSIQNQLQLLEAKLLDPDDLVAKLVEATKISSSALLELDVSFILTSLENSTTSSSGNPRYNDVFDAAPDTCDWIFESHEVLSRTCHTLKISWSDWLKEGHGIFHIAGKPGAGKSTLMRHVYKSPTTRQLLQLWAGKDELVLAKYFFWKFDSYQNRLIGLKRSILYTVLQKAEVTSPLMALLFPNQMGQGASLSKRERDSSISDDEVELAFSTLVSTKAGLMGRRFCFFIDALDEFDQDTAREDYVDLVLLIQQWAEESDAHVKIVVSSREFPEFQAFDEGQRIRLHLFTVDDMRTIIRSRLQSHPRFKGLKWLDEGADALPGHQQLDDTRHLVDAKSFINYIAIAAEGVFLWTVLVVKELRKGLSRGDSIQKLYAKVKTAPRDLNKLFESIIESIDDFYQREAIILFAAILRFSGNGSPGLSLIECSFFLEAADAGVMEPSQWEPQSEKGFLDEQRDRTEIQITGRFNGLLEISPSKASVKFLHSSIMEVMSRYTSQGLKKHNLTDAQIDQWLCWMIFVWVKQVLKRAALVGRAMEFNVMAKKLRSLLFTLQSKTLEDKTMTMFDKIDTSLLLTWQKSPWQHLDEWSKAQLYRRSGFIITSDTKMEVYSLLLGTVESGRVDYLYWKLDTLQVAWKDGAFGSLLLHYLSTVSLRPGILQGVLERGVSVNCTSDWREGQTWWFCRPHLVWHEYLANVLGAPLKRQSYNPREYCHLWEMVEVWLRHGADPRFWIGLGVNRLEAYQSVGGRIVRCAYQYQLGSLHHEARARLFPRPNTLASVRELVEFISPHNRETLLELLGSKFR